MSRADRYVVILALVGTLLAGCSAQAGISHTAQQSIDPGPANEAVVPAEQPSLSAVDQVADLEPPPDRALLRERLERYVQALPGTWGIYLLEIESGWSLAINGEMVFPAASTFKLPMAMYVLDLVERGRADLSEVLVYQEGDWEEGAGILQETVQVGSTETVGRLIELAITYSDNIAANMLIRRFGWENVQAYMRSLGGTVTVTESGRNATTPREMAAYMEALYTGTAITNPELRRSLLDHLSNTAFQDRIAGGLPAGVPVAHKIGALDGVVNDIGLVMLPEHPFIISIFSLDVGEERAIEAIAEITRIVYRYQQERD